MYYDKVRRPSYGWDKLLEVAADCSHIQFNNAAPHKYLNESQDSLPAL